MRLHRTQDGFTIIELMIATVVFSLTLLVIAAVSSQIGRMYYKGVVTANTQDTTRNLTDELSRTIQFTASVPVEGISVSTLGGKPYVRKSQCFGSIRYTWVVNGQVNSSITNAGQDYAATHHIRHALWRDTDNASIASCPPVDLTVDKPTANGKDVLGEDMRLKSLTVEPGSSCSPGNSCTWIIDVGILYGDDDLIEFNSSGDPTGCKSLATGSQWCALAELHTNVFRRLGVQ